MKKLLGLLLATISVFTVFAFTGCNKDNREILYVYTNAGFAPYEYVNDNGDIVGVDIDIVNEIGNALNYKVVVKDIDFALILGEVEKSKMAIGAAGMTKKAERDAICLASNTYATSVQYIILPKTTQVNLVEGKVKLSDFASLTIGVQEATTGNFLVDDYYEDNNIKIGDSLKTGVTYKTAIQASNDIGTQLGAVVIDKLPAQSICSKNSSLVCYELDEEPESYVIYMNKEATELCSKINEVLAKLISDGKIDEFTNNHSGLSK